MTRTALATPKGRAGTFNGRRAPAGEVSNRVSVMQITWSFVAGGSEMYAFTIASHIDASRYASMLCALDQSGPLEGEIRERGIPHFVMHRPPGVQLSLMWRLYRLFREFHIDVVHTHHFNQLFYSAIGARLARARVIHTEHCVQDLRRWRIRVATRLLSLLCEQVTVISDEIERTLRDEVRIPASKLQVIRAGVDVASYDRSREEARRTLGLSDSDRVAVIVARLYPEKNHRVLLAAFAKVIREVPCARLLIVGDGVEHEAIRQEISCLGLDEHIQMLGVRRDIPEILAASDVFVLSSDDEGLPIAVLEAMAAAKPVVVTAVGDLASVVREGETGRLVPRRNPSALAEALVDTLIDDQRATRMGLNGRRLVEQHFSLDSMVERHEMLYGAR